MAPFAPDSESKSEDYRLMRNSVASCRLNAQHYLWKQTCGFNIHPRILSSALVDRGCEDRDGGLKVADVGTATGIWISDVKLTHPGLRIDGFDKSLEQCPPAELCPEDCSIRQLDILGDVPADLKDVYDVINVRLIQGGLKDDPVPALRNLIAMLKPGGHLQWQEIDLRALSIATVGTGLDQSAMEVLLSEVHDFDFGRWTPRLAEICAENGLLDSRTDRYRVPLEISIPFCQTQFMAYEEISRVSMDNNSPDSKGPRFRESLEKAYAELNKGVWLDHKLEVTVARKAV